MADRRETYAGLLSGDQIGTTITITIPDHDGELIDGVVRVIVHQTGGVVALFMGDLAIPRRVAADAIAAVS